MATLNVSLPDEVKAFIEERVAREGHSSAGDYLATLVREAQRRLAKQELEAKLREAIEREAPTRPDVERSLTEEEFQRRLLELGLMSQVPTGEGDEDDAEDIPVPIRGEPLSETVIRERR
jgi:antitoxin ParD1/3/4